MKVQLITLANPCTACLITENLLKEVFEKTQISLKARGIENIEFETVTLNHPQEIYNVEGLEVEKLPLVIIGGEQVTAGSLIHRRKLEQFIDNYIIP